MCEVSDTLTRKTNRSKSTVDLAPIKEGFLVKKGHLRHNWKTRWFILYRDELRYFKNRGELEPAGTIALTGASLILSPENYKKRESLLQVTCGRTGREFLLQALDRESRDTWGRYVEKQIQAVQKDIQNYLTTHKRSSIASRKLSLYELDAENTALDVRDIVCAMQDKQAGLALRTEQLEGKTHKNIFTGASVVNWLQSWSFAENRSEGVRIGQDLIKKGYIQSVDCLAVTLFRDTKSAFYRFVTLRQETQCEPITDQALLSLMSDTSSSIKRPPPIQPATGRDGRFFTMRTAEVDLVLSVPPYAISHLTHSSTFVADTHPPQLMRSQSLTDLNSLSLSSGDGEDTAFDKSSDTGNIILQSFLLKQKHYQFRQTWSKRKFILREGSNRIAYYTGAKLSTITKKGSCTTPTGTITLGNSTVISVPSEDKFKHIFQIRSEKGKKYLLAATSPEERDNWVTTINNHIAKMCPYKISYDIV